MSVVVVGTRVSDTSEVETEPVVVVSTELSLTDVSTVTPSELETLVKLSAEDVS